MRINIGSGLLPLNLLVIGLIATIIFFPLVPLRVILGLPFILFFPGYVLMLALFPRKERMSGIERVVLSFGLSIAVVPLVGLILNYTWWGITLESILYSMASFIFIISLIALNRRRRLGERERFNVEFQLMMLGRGGSIWDRALSIILVLAILGTFGILVYIVASPKTGESFSELYILGLEGKTVDYPSELVVGEKGRVIVGIINNEHEIASYRVVIKINGVKNNEVGPIVLDNGEKWEREATFVPQVAGKNQKVEFLLYKDRDIEPCFEPLHLWIDVTE